MGHETVLWQATCRYLPIADQIRTARLCSCDILTVTPLDFRLWREAGNTASDLRAIASDNGVRLDHLDPLARWTGAWRADNIPEKFLPFLDFETSTFLDMAVELGAESFSAICTGSAGAVSITEMTDDFADLCRRAAERGLRVDLEFIPIWGLKDLRSAWKIVREVNAPNGGIMFDFWHFMRGGPDFDLLRSIPPEKIHSVQVCDAEMTCGEGRTDLQDCLDDRVPVGEGVFPVERILDTLVEIDATQRIGPEYYSDRMEGLEPEEIAEVVARTYWPVIEDREFGRQSRREAR